MNLSNFKDKSITRGTILIKYLLLFMTITSMEATSLEVPSEASVEINVDNSNFEYVVDEATIDLGRFSFDPFTIDSNIPVTILQYRESFSPARLLPTEIIKIYIKKKCTGEPHEISGSYLKVSDRLATIKMSQPSEDHLYPSTYSGNWTIKNQVSDNCASDGLTSPQPCRVGNPMKKLFAMLNTDVSKSIERTHECAEVVEVLYDPCFVELNVLAPSLQMFNHHEIKGLVTNGDACETKSTATLEYENVPNLTASETSTPQILELYDLEHCFEESYGRPFIDGHGNSVMAQALETGDRLPLWSDFKDKSGDADEAQGNEWVDRAIGEHASIASFASFAIELMTNNAPPDLIADSLQAAMDEFRHAQTSFEMASFLLQKNVSPGHLPATSLSFEQNLNHLAFGVAKEGCVDETVSALLLAAEIMMFDLYKIDKPFSWKDKVTVIAKEEANHSALAWRTIYWACNEDKALCEEIINYMLSEGQARAIRRIQTSGFHLDIDIVENVENEWMKITNILISSLKSPNDQDSMNTIHQSREKNFVNEIGDIILNNVSNAARKTFFSPTANNDSSSV